MTIFRLPPGLPSRGGEEAAKVVILGQPVDAAAADRVGAGIPAPGDSERLARGGDGNDRARLRPDTPRAVPVGLGGVPVVDGAEAGLGVTTAGGGTGELAGGGTGPVADFVAGADAVEEDVGAGAGRGSVDGGGVALVGAVADELSGGVGTHRAGSPGFSCAVDQGPVGRASGGQAAGR